jgi:hypothetical protein
VFGVNCALYAGAVPLGVAADTGTSANKNALVPLWINSLIIPAVTVAVACTSIESIRDPLAPAVNTVPIVPVPSRLVFAVLITTAPTLGTAAYCACVAI